MTYNTILYETDGQVAIITLNRPEVRNAQNEELKDELNAALNVAEADDNVNVVVLRGAGSCFSAGHDMKQFPRDPAAFGAPEGQMWFHGDTEKLRQFVYKIFRNFLNLHYLRKPTIAQVHSHCVAGGWVLASMCDIIVASEDAVFSDPVLRMAALGVEVLVEPWDVGIRKSKELMWTGERLPAEEALNLGMVNKVVPRDKLEEETMQLAHKIAQTPTGAVQASKRSINHALDLMGWRLSHEYHVEQWLANHFGSEHEELNRERAGMDLKEFLMKRDEAYTSEQKPSDRSA